MRSSSVIKALALSSFAIAAPTLADQGGVEAGLLTCDVASGWGLVFGSSRDLKCSYSSGPGASQHYTGTIGKFGVDIGYSGASVIAWTVLAPTTNLAPGALTGTYAGATGNAAVGGGVGANVLFGGGQSIALQPVSFQAGTGLNVAAGIASINLQYQPPPAVGALPPPAPSAQPSQPSR